MLFYMQMRNWFLIFLMLTMIYLIQQRTSNSYRVAFKIPSASLSLIR